MSDMRIANRAVNDMQPAVPARRQTAPVFTPASIDRTSTPAAATASAKPERIKPHPRTPQREPADSGLHGGRSHRARMSDASDAPGRQSLAKGMDCPAKDGEIVAADDQDESDGACVVMPEVRRQDSSDDQPGAGSGMADAGPDAQRRSDLPCAAADGALDLQNLQEDLLPMTGDNGIFEVSLPGGETMGVVVNAQPALVSFLLSPSTEKMRMQLLPQKMELEGHLERRIHRNVKITVL